MQVNTCRPTADGNFPCVICCVRLDILLKEQKISLEFKIHG